MVLTGSALQDLFTQFPNIAERFKTVAAERFKEVNKKRSYRKMIEVKSKMDVVAELEEEPSETGDTVAGE
ncbi:hypothetical protein HK104_007420 [Borealophlyctis nickersoniae]|nr:hypothetical protein HK104_007420 [Borealophlyctis nickersoniae]